MSQYHSLQDQLKQLMTTLRPAKQPPPPNSGNVFLHVCPDLPPEAAERLRCAPCKGTGLLGGSTNPAVDEQPWRCSACAGTGVRCPTCRDMRWLRTTVSGQAGNRPLVRCPDCATPEQRLATIDRYIEAAQAGPEPPA